MTGGSCAASRSAHPARGAAKRAANPTRRAPRALEDVEKVLTDREGQPEQTVNGHLNLGTELGQLDLGKKEAHGTAGVLSRLMLYTASLVDTPAHASGAERDRTEVPGPC
jgi:hypothetical protein